MRKMRKFAKNLKLANDNGFGGGAVPKRLLTAALVGCVAAVGAQSAQAAPVETDRIIVTETDTVISGQTYEDRQSSSYGPDWSIWGTAGGVIQNSGQNLIIKDTIFNNNAARINADNAQDWQAAMGGAVYNAESATIKEINNVTFSGNSAFAGTDAAGGLSGRGGALYNAGSISSIKDSSFTNNSANQGGAIYNQSSGHIGTIDNVVFSGNTADTYPPTGGIFNEGTIDAIQNSSFVNNAGNSSYSGASAIFNTGTISLIKDTSVEGTGVLILNDQGTISEIDGLTVKGQNNISKIFVSSGGKVGNLKNLDIESNTSSGRLFEFQIRDDVGVELGNIENCKFYNNNVGEYAHIISVQNGSIKDIVNSEFKGNNAKFLIDALTTSVGNITNSVFENNTAEVIHLQNNSYTELATLGNIDNSKFINNHKGIVSYNASIGDITNSEFKNNGSEDSLGNGGAIYLMNTNPGTPEMVPTIGKIENTLFEGNFSGAGGAIHIEGSGTHIKEIKGSTFKNNYTLGQYSQPNGGAIDILNGASIGNISDTLFEGNSSVDTGGAIALVNGGTSIGNLTDVMFKNNHAAELGGALYLDGATVGTMTNVYFEGNYGGDNCLGGVINNNGGTIGDWTNGTMYGTGDAHKSSNGGGIFNNGKLGSITNVKFKDLSAKIGGAIFNLGGKDCLGNLTNVSFTNAHADTQGGGIWNSGSSTIGKLTNVSFENATAKDFGGAIYNGGMIADWENGYIIGNNEAPSIQGAGIWNFRKFGNITNVEFRDLSAIDMGGAIFNTIPEYEDNLEHIMGDLTNVSFINNHVLGGGEDADSDYGGGAIANLATIGVLKGAYFESNSAEKLGGAILNTGTMGNIYNSTFKNNKSNSGGAIWDSQKLPDIENSYFEGNETVTKYDDQYEEFGHGGAIYAPHDIGKIKNTTFKNNIAGNSGGAIWTSGSIDMIENSLFEGNKANTSGGALMYYGYDSDNAVNYKASIKNSSFLNNTAEKGRGGAIYATGDLDIAADKGNVIFSGNKDSKGSNDIYIDTTIGTNVNIVAKNNGNLEFHGGIDASHEYNLNVNGDSSSRVVMNGGIKNANMTIADTHVYSDTPAFLTSTTNLAVNSGALNFAKLDNSVYNFNKLSNSGTINVGVVDIDVENETMGRITASNYGDMSKGVVNVADLNLLTNPVKAETKVLFADKAFANTVQYHGKDSVYSPIYKYDISYLPGSGEFMFVRSNGGSGKDAFNPAVLASPSNVQAGSQATMNETFKYVFEHADAFTQFPSTERMAKINANKYALSTDYNANMGSLDTDLNNKAAWVRPYATFETMNLRHGPKVDAVTYGTLVGFDSNFHEMKNGWTSVFTGYLGYNGAQLNYSGADTSMNGGLLGFTETFYKGNFWTALTVSAGASVGETRTMYGKEDFTSLLAGVGSKTGYNFEFKEGKVILQPIMFMSYTFVNTFDFTNASGVRIKNDPMHSIQLNPSVRIIGNLNHGWQPYASVGMVWNLLNESQSTANGIRLPEMSMKPYVEYGVGIQKHWSDKFSAFGQAMIRNGGRNGIALTTGFRWALGREGKPVKHNDKVSLPQTKISLQGSGSEKIPATNLVQPQRKIVSSLNSDKTVKAGERKIVKQLSEVQRISSGKIQNTTKTTCKGLVKAL